MAQRIQFRNDTAANWSAANPVLMQGELGLESDTRFYKIGDGTTPWNALPHAILRTLDELTVALMEDQATPSVPDPGKLKFYAKSLGGRMMLRQLGPSGLSTPLQPSFFQNFITIISTNATSSVSALGMGVTSSGTLSHPAPSSVFGYMTNFATGSTASNHAGTGSVSNSFACGLGGPPDEGGWFFAARLGFPDANYDNTGSSTGSRIFCGMTSSAITSVGSPNPTGNHAFFQRIHQGGGIEDENWVFLTKNGVDPAD